MSCVVLVSQLPLISLVLRNKAAQSLQWKLEIKSVVFSSGCLQHVGNLSGWIKGTKFVKTEVDVILVLWLMCCWLTPECHSLDAAELSARSQSSIRLQIGHNCHKNHFLCESYITLLDYTHAGPHTHADRLGSVVMATLQQHIRECLGERLRVSGRMRAWWWFSFSITDLVPRWWNRSFSNWTLHERQRLMMSVTCERECSSLFFLLRRNHISCIHSSTSKHSLN